MAAVETVPADQGLEFLDEFPTVSRKGGERGSKYDRYFVDGEVVALRRGRDPGFESRDGEPRDVNHLRAALYSRAKALGVDVKTRRVDDDTIALYTYPEGEAPERKPREPKAKAA